MGTTFMPEPRVVAVVSAYRPEKALVDHLEALAQQAAEVVVVDDGSGPESADVLDLAASHGATVIRLEQNSGIAAALNAGVVACSAKDTDFVLVLDQDSLVPAGFVAALVHEYRAAASIRCSPRPLMFREGDD